jgi:hypothetical protein
MLELIKLSSNVNEFKPLPVGMAGIASCFRTGEGVAEDQ